MKPCLLIIDVQKQFVKQSFQTAQSIQAAIEGINAAIALFREKNLPIVCIQNIDEQNNLAPGAADFEVPDELQVLASDLHIHKRYMNSFNKTPLEQHLRELGVDTVIVTGYCAEYCVLGTYRGADDLDLQPRILLGAVAGDIAENIAFVTSISDTISLAALQTTL